MARVWFPFLGFRLQSVEDTKLAKGRSSFFFGSEWLLVAEAENVVFVSGFSFWWSSWNPLFISYSVCRRTKFKAPAPLILSYNYIDVLRPFSGSYA